MKMKNKVNSDGVVPFNSRLICGCGDLMEPLNPLGGTSSVPADSYLYSKKGFIKGIGILNKIKNLKYGFSTKRFGNMAFRFGETEEVVKNRKGFIKAVGLNIKDSVFMKPNHGRAIEIVNFTHKGRGAFAAGTSVGPADALITFNKGVALGLNSADCVPLIITTKKADALALVHAGRLGTDAKIVKTTIKKLANYGVKAEDLAVGIGPSIQKSCYKLKYLDTDIALQWLPFITPIIKGSQILVEESLDGKKQYRVRAKKGSIMVDIIGFNVAQLLEMGVLEENIEIVPVCALCMARRGEIYSHFLSSQFKNSRLFGEGRFMSIAQLS